MRDVVVLEHGVRGIARKAPSLEQRRLAGPAVERQQAPRGRRHETLEVAGPPGHRDTETRRGERVLRVQRPQRLFEGRLSVSQLARGELRRVR